MGSTTHSKNTTSVSKSNLPQSLKEVFDTLPAKIGQKINPQNPCPIGFTLKSKDESRLPFATFYTCQAIKEDSFLKRLQMNTVGDLIGYINLDLNEKNTVVGADFNTLNSFVSSYAQTYKVDKDFNKNAFLDFEITPAIRAVSLATNYDGKQASIASIAFESVALEYRFDPKEANFCSESDYKKFHGCSVMSSIPIWLTEYIRIGKAMGKTSNSWDYHGLAERAVKFVKKAEPAMKQKVDSLPPAQKSEVQAFINNWISLASSTQNWVLYQKNLFKVKE
nr:hypothetical protein HAGR004_05900 [Bdellovibrio sp. HAGR004]